MKEALITLIPQEEGQILLVIAERGGSFERGTKTYKAIILTEDDARALGVALKTHCANVAMEKRLSTPIGKSPS